MAKFLVTALQRENQNMYSHVLMSICATNLLALVEDQPSASGGFFLHYINICNIVSFINKTKSTWDISFSSSDQLERSCVCDLKSFYTCFNHAYDICHD